MSVACFECYIAAQLAGLTACPRHATPAERDAANRRVLDLANQPHPLLARMRRSR